MHSSKSKGDRVVFHLEKGERKGAGSIYLVSASKDRTFKALGANKMKELELAKRLEHADAVCGAAFSPVGRWIVSGICDGTLKMSDASRAIG